MRLPLDVLIVVHAPTPRTTRRAARSSRRSRTASARRSARTIREPRRTRWRSRRRKRGDDARRAAARRSKCRPSCARSWKRSRSRRAPIRKIDKPVRRQPAPADLRAGERGARTPSAALHRRRSRRRAARDRRLRGAAVDHRQVRARIRRRTEGRRGRRRELVRQAVATVFDGYAPRPDARPIIEWFDGGGSARSWRDTTPARGRWCASTSRRRVRRASAGCRRAGERDADAAARRLALDFVLEGLYAPKKISRSDERRLTSRPAARAAVSRAARRAAGTCGERYDDRRRRRGRSSCN